MRIRIGCAAVVLLTAVPAFAQSPEVTGPRTLTGHMVTCTDLPVVAKPIPRLTVFGPFDSDKHYATTRGTLVIKRQPDDGLAVGQRYFTQRIQGDPKRFPKPGEGFGDLRVTGWVTIRALDEVNAMAAVDFACDSIENGDFLEPYMEAVIPAEAAPSIPPDFTDRGSVLFGADNRSMFGDGDIMSIDRGTLHGVVPGSRYALYRDRKDGMPLVYIGEAVVLTTGEATSKAMVTKALDAISSGDLAVPRRTP